MSSPASTTLLFRVSDETAMRTLVRELSAVFHVVPAALPDAAGHILSVEVEAGASELQDEVRRLVQDTDGRAVEMHLQSES